MAAGLEPEGMRRRNFQRIVHELAQQFRAWRREQPHRRERLSPYSSESTPPLGDLDDAAIDYWALQVSLRDAERSIRQSQEAVGRAKTRLGEAQ